ncbi:hypothetical protein ACQE32_07000 [Pantoea sp. FN0302]|uniref:hypothetical protein n=1 Tax=Pantoea sp. FN0302 TaxID=3418558 RepID=UPI003CF9A209
MVSSWLSLRLYDYFSTKRKPIQCQLYALLFKKLLKAGLSIASGSDTQDVRFSRIADIGLRGREYDGLNVWLPLRNDPVALISLMKERGWLIRSGAGFYLTAPRHAIRLTPGVLGDGQAEALAQDLASALRGSGNAVIAA